MVASSKSDAIDITSAGVVTLSATTASSSSTTGALVVGGGAGIASDVYVGGNIRASADSSIISLGAGNDFTITHDGTTGATIAGTPTCLAKRMCSRV